MSESITPTFSGEVQFRRYSDTSTQGVQIVLALHDREAMKPFIGKEGKRFMAVLVEIGDDEQPVAGIPASAPKEREQLGQLCYRAVMLCSDAGFQEWIRDVAKVRHLPASPELAKDIVCAWCQIKSRKELDEVAEAGAYFKAEIVAPWMKHQMAGSR